MKALFNSVVLDVSIVISLAFLAPSANGEELGRIVPTMVGNFRQIGTIRPVHEPLVGQGVSSGEVEYLTETGKRLLVQVVQFPRDADAYSLVTRFANDVSAPIEGQVGTASMMSGSYLVFYKGTTFVRISGRDTNTNGAETLQLGHLLANVIDKGEGEIPVLVKHLPDWEDAEKRALYFPGFKSLQSVAPDQSVLSVLDSAGDADAVVANYGTAKLAVIEFNTPQLAGDNDRVIVAKIVELKSQNQPVPTAYRRVGNYGVFVFNAESEQAANNLIDKIKYEQVVQWLGDNPYWFKEAQRRYTETTLGVLIAVVKASGLTLVICFGLGGLIGALLFSRRRAQQASVEAFSDAGGMLRLNLDEMTPETDPARLIAGRN